MFRTLRLKYDLSQAEIAERTHRTPNYILKAEQLVFPTPPPALIDFFVKLEPEAYNEELLTEWYYTEQHKQREKWLSHYRPRPLDTRGFSFRRKWLSVSGSADDQDFVSPTEYAVSKGLCIPASAVYLIERKGTVPSIFVDVMDYLIAYVTSGRYTADTYYDDGEVNNLATGLIRIRKELS